MKKVLVLSLALMGFLVVSAGQVSACPPKDGGHPHSFMILEHAKELGLSRKQKSQIEKIQKDLSNDIKELGQKYDEKVKGVLTPEQQKKYEDMQPSSGCGQHKMRHHKGCKKDESSCPMKKK